MLHVTMSQVCYCNEDGSNLKDLLQSWSGCEDVVCNDKSIVGALPKIDQSNWVLKSLYLEYNQFDDISSVSAFKNLTSLWVDNNKLRDVSVLRDMPWLRSIDVSSNFLTSIDPICEIPELVEL